MQEAPLRIDDPDHVEWHDSADVIVVGFGGAGAAAAIEARRRGADVLAFDNFRGGGATAVSGGINYAGQTRIQKEAGVDDTVEDMFRYLQAEGAPVKPETLRRFCEESSRNIDWLADMGVPYRGTAYHEKCTIPPRHAAIASSPMRFAGTCISPS
jgi:3-oxo-5alpha-steroid 4-dehydrogenase